MRRREAAHTFLDLLEMGLAQGRSPENTVVEVAATGDKIIGEEFHQIARRIRDGASLGHALESTPMFLPEPVAAMLQAGERLGDIRKVLPACRDTLSAGPSRAMGAFNYLPVFSPLLPLLAVVLFLCIVIIPKFQGIFHDLLETGPLPIATLMVITYAKALLGFSVFAAVLGFLVLLLGRARRRWPSAYSRTIKALCDQWLFRLPWRRKRMQRDFSAILAILLDTGVPESEAVRLAARSTANYVFVTRSQRVIEHLQGGEKLTGAIRAVDDSGEFQWRLANAAHGPGGFLRSLQGWHDTLDAKAYQQEQAASQVLSTVLIILNGVLVSIVVLAIFQPIIALIQREALW
ncbi:MAG TPA: type II secretion system F family protein [Verrucomicrobiae bacterium]|nr:type II secretion system F family protein [Verrucomicrobiae bacterium]